MHEISKEYFEKQQLQQKSESAKLIVKLNREIESDNELTIF